MVDQAIRFSAVLGLSYLSVMGNDGYVELAVELANNVERLRSLKNSVAGKKRQGRRIATRGNLL